MLPKSILLPRLLKIVHQCQPWQLVILHTWVPPDFLENVSLNNCRKTCTYRLQAKEVQETAIFGHTWKWTHQSCWESPSWGRKMWNNWFITRVHNIPEKTCCVVSKGLPCLLRKSQLLVNSKSFAADKQSVRKGCSVWSKPVKTLEQRRKIPAAWTLN